MFPNDRVSVYPSGTVDWARKKMQSITPPKLVIIHLGTNDLESQTPQAVHSNLVHFKCELEDKFKCRTLVSCILPRNDHLNQATVICNDLLQSTIPDALIKHRNIQSVHLHDKKHLSFRNNPPNVLSGCQRLSHDLFDAVHNTAPEISVLSSAIRLPQRSPTKSPRRSAKVQNQRQLNSRQNNSQFTTYPPTSDSNAGVTSYNNAFYQPFVQPWFDNKAWVPPQNLSSFY